MAGRFTYSRWDGTQTGFDMETSDLFDELADDLLNNGDLRGALRRFMERGARDANGEKLQGLREMRQKLKQARQLVFSEAEGSSAVAPAYQTNAR